MKKQLLDEEYYFDQYEALHTVCTLYHEGMWSLKYAILSQSRFKPRPTWSEENVMKDNYFYNEVVEYSDDELEQLFIELNKYIEKKSE